MKSGWLVMGVMLAVGLTTATAVAEDVVVVTVTGQGASRDAAKRDALRRALEQGGRQEISSYSQVENFTMIRDAIYSRAEGIVTDYRVLKEGPGAGGVFYCEIQAKVSKSAIATTWGEVQNVLDQIGRPGVMVLITEYIDDVPDDSSILESRIEERLHESGFDVYAGDHVREIARRESADARAEGDVAKMQAIAKDFGTQIFVVGSAHANYSGVENLYGARVAMYNGDAVVKMYYTDTGRLLASKSLPNWRGGARGHFTRNKQAGKKALANAGDEIVEMVYRTCMESWATQISAGGDVRIEVAGVNFKQANDIKNRLAAIEGVQKVNFKLTKGIASYRVVSKVSAQDLAVAISNADLFDIIDLKLNRIQGEMPQG